MQAIDTFIATHKQIIEKLLDNILTDRKASHNLFTAMRYAVLNNGKRLRPNLIYATGSVLNVPIEHLHACAIAVELIHCYSLVHDDLPAMDDDDLRRGVPTCHKAFDEATAILVGDALQSLAFEVLADADLNPLSSEQRIAMVSALAKASGAAGMVLGQAEDLAAEYRKLDLEPLIQLHNHKTGALFQVCIELALIAANKQHDTELKRSLLEYGYNLGLAFQIQDDILDITSDDLTLGKPVGSDVAMGKSTFPSLLGLDGAQKYATQTFNQAMSCLEQLAIDTKLLKLLANFLVIRSN